MEELDLQIQSKENLYSNISSETESVIQKTRNNLKNVDYIKIVS